LAAARRAMVDGPLPLARGLGLIQRPELHIIHSFGEAQR